MTKPQWCGLAFTLWVVWLLRQPAAVRTGMRCPALQWKKSTDGP